MDAKARHAVQQLRQLAHGLPGAGEQEFWRVTGLCQQIHAANPNPQLLMRLRHLQAIMKDWLLPLRWQGHEHALEPLRAEVLRCIDAVDDCACFEQDATGEVEPRRAARG